MLGKAPRDTADSDIDHFIHMLFHREGRYGSKPSQCDDETSQGVQRLVPGGLLVSIDTAKGGLVTGKVS
jgi:hypothetical protein